MNTKKSVATRFACAAAMAFSIWVSHANAQNRNLADVAGVHGGLVIQLGASDTQTAAKLSLTGRYLIHVLDPDARTIQTARKQLRKDGHYGLTWAEQARDKDRLPYAENLANLVIVRDYSVPIKELNRVLAPGGSVVVTNAEVLKQSDLTAGGFASFSNADSTLIARKPWPRAMDVNS